MEKKKEYKAPEIKEIELRHRTNLLQGSDYTGNLGMSFMPENHNA